MKIIGITGGVGAGKSAILAFFEREYNACILQADLIAHELQMPGKACYAEIIKVFGSSVLTAEGLIDRKTLGNIVFQDKEKLQQLNQIVHPAVKKAIIEKIATIEQQGIYSLVVLEAALLIEDHYDMICDELWYIDTKDNIRRERLKHTRGYSDDKIDRMFLSQLSREEFLKACQVVIDNSGTLEETYRQIREEYQCQR